MITHVWCEMCGSIQPVLIESMDVPCEPEYGDYLGGDILCSKCRLVLLTIYRTSNNIESTQTADNPASPVQQLKAKIAAIADKLDEYEYAESGTISVDFAALKRELRQLSAVD